MLNPKLKYIFRGAKKGIHLQEIGVLFILFTTLNISLAQTKNSIIIDRWNTASRTQINDTWIDTLKGQVLLHQGDNFFECDTAVLQNNQLLAWGKVILQQKDSLWVYGNRLNYNGDTKKAYLHGEVVLVNKQQKLFTEQLDYDLNTKLATFNTKGTMTEGKTAMISDRGVYDVNLDQARFYSNVQIQDPEFLVKTDSLYFNSKSKEAQFVSPTIIQYKDSKIYTESGIYNISNRQAVFDGKPQYLSPTQKAKARKITYNGDLQAFNLIGDAFIEEKNQTAQADSIVYFEKSEKAQFFGKASLKGEQINARGDTLYYDKKTKIFSSAGPSIFSDSTQIIQADETIFDQNTGMGMLRKNVYWQDTVQKVSIRTQNLDLDKTKKEFRAYGGRNLIAIASGSDTIYIAADTLRRESISTADSSKILRAYPDVRVWMKDMQLVCDSLAFAEKDSIFRFLGRPIMWYDSGRTQLASDTLFMYAKNKKLDKIHLQQNATVLSQKDSIFFDQVFGRTIYSHFEDGKINLMEVIGNAETVYYAQDDDKAYIGVNHKLGARMNLHFLDKKLQQIRFYTQPEGKFIPIQTADHLGLRIKTFQWHPDWRPLILNDILDPSKRRK